MAKILIVDDSAIIRRQLSAMLEELGHEIIGVAEDGALGCESYEKLKPDLVTMDINMPNMDGLSAVKKIIGLDADAIIIMVSSIEDRSITYQAIGAGATDFINKPIQIEELKEKIDEALT